ncbi:MAG: DUF5063 domain-containing protein, partial [Bacteroidaceae bacterium]|nr:DUF5063 domain-containing protein [Bacteroidaceae bacterium]
MATKEDIVFSRNTIEFVTVAAEFCAYLERIGEYTKKEFVGTMLKLLPLMYIKAQMLPDEERASEDDAQEFVTEESYEVLRISLAELLSE